MHAQCKRLALDAANSPAEGVGPTCQIPAEEKVVIWVYSRKHQRTLQQVPTCIRMDRGIIMLKDEGRSHLQSVAAITRCPLQSVAAITRCSGKSWNPQTDLLLYISVDLEFANTRDEVISKALRL